MMKIARIILALFSRTALGFSPRITGRTLMSPRRAVWSGSFLREPPKSRQAMAFFTSARQSFLPRGGGQLSTARSRSHANRMVQMRLQRTFQSRPRKHPTHPPERPQHHQKRPPHHTRCRGHAVALACAIGTQLLYVRRNGDRSDRSRDFTFRLLRLAPSDW